MKKCWQPIWSIVAFSVLLLVLPACGGGGGGGGDGSPAPTAEPDPTPAITAETGTLVEEATFNQPLGSLEKTVDILIVMDSSGSLDDERAALAAAVPEILDELEALDSYTLSMILAWGSPVATADYEGSGHLYQVGNYPYVFDSELDSGEYIRTGVAATIKAPPPKDNTGEAGLYALHRFLTVHSEKAKERGTLRDDAAFVAIFMSDENDICAVYPVDVTPVPDPGGGETRAFEEYCVNADGDIIITPEKVYQAAKDTVAVPPVRFAGLIYTNEDDVPEGGENEVGYGYKEAIRLSEGTTIDLAAPDYATLAKDIGNIINALAADLKVRFPLSFGPVNPLSIEVLVDGQLEASNYYEESGEVELSYAGGSGSTIDIRYRVLE